MQHHWRSSYSRSRDESWSNSQKLEGRAHESRSSYGRSWDRCRSSSRKLQGRALTATLISEITAFVCEKGGSCQLAYVSSRYQGVRKEDLQKHFIVKSQGNGVDIIQLFGQRGREAENTPGIGPSSYVNRRSRSSSAKGSKLASELLDGTKLCYKYNNKDDFCDGKCGMEHCCQKCLGPHPKYECTPNNRRKAGSAEKGEASHREKARAHRSKRNSSLERETSHRSDVSHRENRKGSLRRSRSRSRALDFERTRGEAKSSECDSRSLTQRLISHLRSDDIKVACNLARDARSEFTGLFSPQGIMAQLQAEVESQLNIERVRLMGQVATIGEALGATSQIVTTSMPLVMKLSPEQRLRAEVLARHVARLGDRGATLQAAVLHGTRHDMRWLINGPEYAAILEKARTHFVHGARPAADQMLRDQFGVGGAGGGLHEEKGTPLEAGDSEPSTTRFEKHPHSLLISSIFWSHDAISETFRQTGSILELSIKLLVGSVDAEDLPPLRVIFHRHKWHLLTGNRRLAVWRLVSFFDPHFSRIRVQAESPSSKEFSEFLTGNGRHRAKLSTKKNACDCEGRWARVSETGETVGRVLTLDTYGCDLLWLMFRPDDPFPASRSKEKNYFKWRSRLIAAVSAQGHPTKDIVKQASKVEAQRCLHKRSKLEAKASRLEAANSIPQDWVQDGYLWLP